MTIWSNYSSFNHTYLYSILFSIPNQLCPSTYACHLAYKMCFKKSRAWKSFENEMWFKKYVWPRLDSQTKARQSDQGMEEFLFRHGECLKFFNVQEKDQNKPLDTFYIAKGMSFLLKLSIVLWFWNRETLKKKMYFNPEIGFVLMPMTCHSPLPVITFQE